MNISKAQHATAKGITRGLAVWLRGIRETRSISQAEFARQLGEQRSNLCSIEAGERSAGLPSLVAMADALGYRIVFSLERINHNKGGSPK